MTEDAPPFGRRAPERRRSAVLDAARTLFLDAGVARTSVDAIARQAGVAKGTVFLSFASKDQIVQALEAEFNARIVTRTRSAAQAASGGPTATVAAWCVELVHAYLDDLDLHDMLFYGGAPATREGVSENALVDDLEALLASLRIGSPAPTAAFLVGGITMLTDRTVLHDRTPDRTALVRTVQDLATATAQHGLPVDSPTDREAPARP